MEAIAPSEAAVSVLREISRAGFDYAQTKALCEPAGWTLVHDDPLDFLLYDMLLTGRSGERRPLYVTIAIEHGITGSAFVALFYFKDYDEGRAPFDEAFRSLAVRLAGFLGQPSRVGEYSYPHRAGWSYSFAGWQMPEVTLVLVQDEYDIQFGMDVTLWVRPAGSAVEVPVRAT